LANANTRGKKAEGGKLREGKKGENGGGKLAGKRVWGEKKKGGKKTTRTYSLRRVGIQSGGEGGSLDSVVVFRGEGREKKKNTKGGREKGIRGRNADTFAPPDRCS